MRGPAVMKMPPDFVIFDCDGVLVDSEHISNLVIRDNLASYGLALDVSEIDRLFVGGTLIGMMDKARSMGAALPDDWLDEIYDVMLTRLAETVEPVPGVIDLLNRLDALGIGYAVGSNGPHAKIDVTLQRTGLSDRLAGRIYSREDVANPKPAPDVYLKAARDAGMRPDRCVVVEDSPNGAMAGIAAGMITLGFAARTEPSRLQPICNHVFEDMHAIARFLAVLD